MSIKTVYEKREVTVYVCDICGAEFGTGSDYAHHMHRRHPDALGYRLGEVLLGSGNDIVYVRALVCRDDGVLRYSLASMWQGPSPETHTEQELDRDYVRLDGLDRDELVSHLLQQSGMEACCSLEELVTQLMERTGLGARLDLEPLEIRDDRMILSTPVTSVLRSLLRELAGLGARLDLEPLEIRDDRMILSTPVTSVLRSLLLELAQGATEKEASDGQ